MTRSAMRTMVLAAALGLFGQILAAQSLQDDLVAQLRAQGFTEFTVEETLLGRIRILAISPTLRREIVVTRNGDILRDYWEALTGDDTPRLILADPGDDDDSGNHGGGADDGSGDTDDGGGSGSGEDADGDGSGSGEDADGDGSGSGEDADGDGSEDDGGSGGSGENDSGSGGDDGSGSGGDDGGDDGN